MAVAYRSSAAHSGNPTTTPTVTIPSDVVADDILILTISNGGASANPATVLDTDVTGNLWTMKGGQANGSEGGSVWWKRATSATASKVVTATGLTDSSAAMVAAYSGCKTTGDPFNQFTSEANASSNETMAGFTPSVNGCMICLDVCIGEIGNIQTQSSTSPGSLTERVQADSTGGSDSCVAHASALQTTAGATGSLTWAQPNSTTVSFAYALEPPGAGAFTIDASPGSYAIAGLAATIGAGRIINAAAGAYALTGILTALDRGYNFNAQPGSYAVDGAATALLAARMLSCDPGSYQTTGAAVNLAAGLLFNAEPGAYAITGQPATLARGLFLAANPGAYAIVGAAGDLVFVGVGNFVLSADSGTYSVAGTQAAPLADRILSLESGVYALTGAEAAALADRLLSATPGNYTVDGQMAALNAQRTLSVDPGAYTITGQSIANLIERVLSAGPGVYAITGADAAFVADVVAVVYAYKLTELETEFAIKELLPTFKVTEIGAEYILREVS